MKPLILAGAMLLATGTACFADGMFWVVGNHDADGPQALPGDTVDEIVLSGLTLRHEQALDTYEARHDEATWLKAK